MKNNYTRLSNEILEALARTNLSSYEWRFLMVIFRKTYGYQKKEDWISLSQVVSATGMHKSHVSRTKAKLIVRNIVTQTGNNIAFNKHCSQWIELPEQVTNGRKRVTQTGNVLLPKQVIRGLPKQVPTKETFTKKTLTKENPSGAAAIPRAPTPGFFPPLPMSSDFVVEPDGTSTKRLPHQKRKNVRAAFTWNDDAELVRIMKQTCGFTTLENGRKPQDNWARHILVKLYKILVDDYGREDQDAIDHIRSNMEEFCTIVQRARDTNKFLWSKLTTLKSIYYEIATIFETVKTPSKKTTSHLSL